MFFLMNLPAHAGDVVNEKSIGMELARDIADETISACREEGFHISAVVVDRPKLDDIVLETSQSLEGAKEFVDRFEALGTPAGSSGIQQIKHLLLGDRVRHGNLCRIEIRECRSDPPGSGHHSRNTKARIVGAFVANHLKRHPGHRLAGKSRLSIFVGHRSRKGS